jgi:hypothetical protein
LAVVLALVLATAASAAPTTRPGWLPPRTISDPAADGAVPSVAVDAAGDVYVVWAQAEGSTWTVQEVERPAGGAWSVPRALSDTAGHVGTPEIAVAGRFAIASWERYDGKNLIAQASVRDPAGDWSAPVSLSPTGQDALVPEVAVDARGDAAVIWASLGPGGWTVQAAYRGVGQGWQLGALLASPAQGTAAPDVAFDRSGNAVAVWAATDGKGWQAQASYRPIAGTWGAVATLSARDPTGSLEPRVVTEQNGDALAVWSRTFNATSMVETATRSVATGTWGKARRLSAAGQNALDPGVAVDPHGYGIVVWTGSTTGGLDVVAVTRHPGKSWGKPTPITGVVSGPLSPSIALDDRGDALAAWSHAAGTGSRIQAAYLLAGATSWSPSRSLSDPGADAITPQVGLDAGGDGAVVWARYDGTTFVIQGDGFDVNGPALQRLVLPAQGVARRKVVFSVAPKDVWSAVRSVRWSFGDGSTADGRRVGHVYARAGTFTVQVSTTDSFGHVTTLRRRIAIAAG